jgi:hypothetical protein
MRATFFNLSGLLLKGRCRYITESVIRVKKAVMVRHPKRDASASSADNLIRLKSIAFKGLPLYPLPCTLVPVSPARVELCIDNAGDIHYR